MACAAGEDGLRRTRAPSRILSHATRTSTPSDAGVYVLPQLLAPEERARVHDDVRALGAVVCTEREEANTLLTVLRAPRRIERHTSAEERVGSVLMQRTKPIVALAWLAACAAHGVCVDKGPFRVLGAEAHTAACTEAHAPVLHNPNAARTEAEALSAHARLHAPQGMPLPASDAAACGAEGPEPSVLDAGAAAHTPSPEAECATLYGADAVHRASPALPAWHACLDDVPDEASEAAAWAHAPPWSNTESVLFRPTPLRSAHNQALVDELQLLRQHRRLTHDTYSELAYMRAAAAVKALPYPLAGVPHASLCHIKGIGAKMAAVIAQFGAQGTIAEADTVRADAAVQTLLRFTTLYGVGPHTAARAYEQGCRTLPDLTRSHATALSTHLGVAESLALLPDLEQRIPRAEVVAIADAIMQELHTLVPTAVATLAGSFRRGAPDSGDVDLVITHDTHPHTPGIALTQLVDRLRRTGQVTHTVALARRAAATSGGPHVAVAQLVYRATPHSVHRRVDLVYASRELYGAALLGWTGSALYERDLRRHARARGFVVRPHLRAEAHQFSATGVTREADGALLSTPSEQSV